MNMNTHIKTIGILGASGYIGMSLCVHIAKHNLASKIHIFSRNKAHTKHVTQELDKQGVSPTLFEVHENSHMLEISTDILINCAGIGKPKDIAHHALEVIDITESMDHLLYKYGNRFPDTVIINMSSGSVYGQSVPGVDDNTKVEFACNILHVRDMYRVAKFYSEVKHRTWTDINIADIRIYAFASEYIDLNSGFFLADIIKAIQSQDVLEVSPVNIVRDYVSAQDLFELIRCIYITKSRGVFDVFSKAPLEKNELLEAVHNQFHMEYVYKHVDNALSVPKDIYVPYWKKAQDIGYKPSQSSMETVLEVIEKYLSR
jgi:nucleoside-diphosphate-sugar epimerase